MQELKLDQITIENLQARESTDPDTIHDYAEALNLGVQFPAVIVFFDGHDYYLADGFHRYFAAKQNGQKSITAVVKQGSHADAIVFACGANKEHGLKRSNADKRKAVVLMLENRPQLSDRAIAEHVGVNHHLVAEIRAESVTKTPSVSSALSTGVGELPVPSACKSTKRLLPRRTGLDGKNRPAERPKTGPKDKVGREIPPGILDAWNKAEKAKDLMRNISELRGLFRRGQEDKEIKKVWPHCNFNLLYSEISNVYTHFSVAIPYAVCPTCQGKITAGCRLCRETGYISEHTWNTAVPRETKDIIKGL